MTLVALDTNCFIDAVTPSAHAYQAMRQILSAQALELRVSLHTIHELEISNESHPDAALKLAQAVPRLPYFPIGAINELLGRIDGLDGTLDDMEINQSLELRLESLSKAGTDLRDRGAVVDALRAGVDAFITSDGQLCKKGPAARIEAELRIRVLTPESLAQALRL